MAITKEPQKPDARAETISLRLQPEKKAELDAMAKKVGMNRSSLIQLAVQRLLKQGL